MESQILFPKDQRLNTEFKDDGKYNTESINRVLSWLEKYHKALIVAEKELEEIGTEIIYSKKEISENERMREGMHITTGKFGFYGLLNTLKKYKNALKSAEQQIQKLK